MLHGTYCRSAAAQDDSARHDGAKTSLRHDGEDRPAKSPTCLKSLRPEAAIPAIL